AFLVTAIGLPAALLLPAAALVHGLRLIGRLEARADRNWLVFLAGTTVPLPAALGLATSGAGIEVTAWGGMWGHTLAYYMASGFGTVGAWLIVVLALSALAVVTLAWNPLRMLFGRTPARGASVVEKSPAFVPAATLLEPPPEE